jgi:hypothetical protein
MIVPLSGQARAAPASKLELTPGMRALAPSFAGLPGLSGTSGAASGGTMMGVANTPPTKPAGRHRAVLVSVPIALVMAAVGALATSLLAPSHRGGVAEGRRPTTTATAPAASTLPGPLETASLAPLAAPQADPAVRAVVLPPNAQAHVDGGDAKAPRGVAVAPPSGPPRPAATTATPAATGGMHMEMK